MRKREDWRKKNGKWRSWSGWQVFRRVGQKEKGKDRLSLKIIEVFHILKF